LGGKIGARKSLKESVGMKFESEMSERAIVVAKPKSRVPVKGRKQRNAGGDLARLESGSMGPKEEQAVQRGFVGVLGSQPRVLIKRSK